MQEVFISAEKESLECRNTRVKAQLIADVGGSPPESAGISKQIPPD